METLEAYLVRKHHELELLNGCLDKPLAVRRPVSVTEVIEGKFQIAAALKAERRRTERRSGERRAMSLGPPGAERRRSPERRSGRDRRGR